LTEGRFKLDNPINLIRVGFMRRYFPLYLILFTFIPLTVFAQVDNPEAIAAGMLGAMKGIAMAVLIGLVILIFKLIKYLTKKTVSGVKTGYTKVKDKVKDIDIAIPVKIRDSGIPVKDSGIIPSNLENLSKEELDLAISALQKIKGSK
jgi:hypothetical protein